MYICVSCGAEYPYCHNTQPGYIPYLKDLSMSDFPFLQQNSIERISDHSAMHNYTLACHPGLAKVHAGQAWRLVTRYLCEKLRDENPSYTYYVVLCQACSPIIVLV